MKYKTIDCPKCGAPLNINPEIESPFIFCQYCGTKLVLDGDRFTYNKNETYRTVDDAKIKEAEVRRDIRFRELDYAEKRDRRKTGRWKFIAVLVIVGILLLAVLGMYLRTKKLEADYQAQLVSSGAEEQTLHVTPEITVNVATVSSAVKNAGELITYKYFYTDIGNYEKDKKLFKKWSIPFTKDRTIYSYSGTISLGVHTKDIKVEVDEDKKQINLTVPKIEIMSSVIDRDSFKDYDIKNSIFTSTSLGEYQKLIDELQKSQEESLKTKTEIFKEAQVSLENTLKGLLSVYTEEGAYKINVSFK